MAQDIVIQGFGTPGGSSFVMRQGYAAPTPFNSNIILQGMNSLFFETQGYAFGLAQPFVPLNRSSIVTGSPFGGFSRS